MSIKNDWLMNEDNPVIKLSATYDKSTKTTWRYIIQENDYDISGTLYVKKVEGVKDKDAPETLLIKVRTK